jgi:hypothetical protein
VQISNFKGGPIFRSLTVSNPELTSKRRNSYTNFELIDDNGKSLSVYSAGTLSVKEWDKVKVTGRYGVRKIVLKYTFYNEIDVISVENLE